MEEIKDIFYQAIVQILPNFSQDKIRFSYQSEGQPFFNISDTFIYIDVSTQDDMYSKQNDFEERYDEETDKIKLKRLRTIVYKLNLIVYGKDSYSVLNQIQDGFFMEKIKRFMKQNRLYLLPTFENIIVTHENINNCWFNRCDWNCLFNYAYESAEEEVNIINSAEIIIRKE
ncbi:hypothetical protein IJJ97_03600 [bacterium]|nr:hypothetical protein [bacterium]